jgi:hypothetical protein
MLLKTTPCSNYGEFKTGITPHLYESWKFLLHYHQRQSCIYITVTGSMFLDYQHPYLRVYMPHFFDKNSPSKIEVQLIQGILCPFDD